MNDTVNKIDQKIVGYRVKPSQTEEKSEEQLKETYVEVPEKPKGINENVNRESVLEGKTYKLKPSNSEFSYYVTINHQEIEGKIYPFELFINSKCVEHLEWITTITRTISAVFRKGGDTSFLIDELKAVHSANGGYWGKDYFNTGKRKYYPSIIAELGYVLEYHFNWLKELNESIKVLDEVVSDSTANLIEMTVTDMLIFPDEKLAKEWSGNFLKPMQETEGKQLPQCQKCKEHALVLMDGCLTCSACGDSKCG